MKLGHLPGKRSHSKAATPWCNPTCPGLMWYCNPTRCSMPVLSTTYYLLPTTYYLLPTTYYLLGVL